MDLSVFGIQSTTLMITALLTGVVLVVGALVIAWLIAPHSYTQRKGEPYECGIPTRGDSMAQFHVGYYLFAILFLMFDVETVFLFPWAVICKEIGATALVGVGTFLVILVLGLAYAWKKGALRWK
jgi:NADH-quinone oxidoreductase subunit A